MSSAFALAMAADTPAARACGCFTPPDPSVPVVQAGERILFAMKDGQVTAHIQIQYQGNATEFGWLLPLPSIPNMELGTDELFNTLLGNTQPKYRLVRKYEGNCGFGGPPLLAPTASGAANRGAGGPEGAFDSNSPLVFQASIGPYDYAVLKADSKDPMLKWLADNRYFVPAGTDQTVGAYIRPGAFFLALKLQSGKATGDLQPVVVTYASDLPMIPIVLTSVAAQPHMGIQVWMLGQHRAIPRNYYHTVINDLMIDWFNAGQNYNDVIIGAVAEAQGKHSYVTEFAGSSKIMQKVLNPPGRFGDQASLAAMPDAPSFVRQLFKTGFQLTSPVVAILQRAIPMPAALAKQGLSPQSFYQQLDYYLGQYRMQNPAVFDGWPGITYDGPNMAKELFERVVKPTLAAGVLFDDNPYLTRLYTTLSPEDMNLDPVFSFNSELPDIGNVHEATLTYFCGRFGSSNNPSTTPAELLTEQGWIRNFPDGTGQQNPTPPTGYAFSRQIQVLREAGKPEIMIDNPPSNGCACAVSQAQSFGGGTVLAFLMGVVLIGRRRRRG